jgi:hypothetical protein
LIVFTECFVDRNKTEQRKMFYRTENLSFEIPWMATGWKRSGGGRWTSRGVVAWQTATFSARERELRIVLVETPDFFFWEAGGGKIPHFPPIEDIVFASYYTTCTSTYW